MYVIRRKRDLLKFSNKSIPVCRIDKNPLGTKGCTSVLSCREYRASCGASFPVGREKIARLGMFRHLVPSR